MTIMSGNFGQPSEHFENKPHEIVNGSLSKWTDNSEDNLRNIDLLLKV